MKEGRDAAVLRPFDWADGRPAGQEGDVRGARSRQAGRQAKRKRADRRHDVHVPTHLGHGVGGWQGVAAAERALQTPDDRWMVVRVHAVVRSA